MVSKDLKEKTSSMAVREEKRSRRSCCSFWYDKNFWDLVMISMLGPLMIGSASLTITGGTLYIGMVYTRGQNKDPVKLQVDYKLLSNHSINLINKESESSYNNNDPFYQWIDDHLKTMKFGIRKDQLKSEEFTLNAWCTILDNHDEYDECSFKIECMLPSSSSYLTTATMIVVPLGCQQISTN